MMRRQHRKHFAEKLPDRRPAPSNVASEAAQILFFEKETGAEVQRTQANPRNPAVPPSRAG